MSFLSDKVYDNMDWLSQAVEPYHCDINDILGALPDEYILTYKDAIRLVTNSYVPAINRSEVLITLCNDVFKKNIGYLEMDNIEDCFRLETSDRVVIDSENSSMEGYIKIVKISNAINDKTIKHVMKQSASLFGNWKQALPDAVKDLGALLFTNLDHKFFKARSHRQRFYIIHELMGAAVEHDIFKIRSVKAWVDFINLVEIYLKEGKEEHLGMIYRIIMMAKEGKVTYDIQK